jgi:hypothetical protein
MEIWFPHIVLFCGLYLQLSLQFKDSAVFIKKHHPIRGSYERIDKISWIFITVGFLWGLQDLLLS